MTNQTWNIPRWTILLVAGLLSSIVANHPAQAQCLFGMSRPAFSVDIRNAEFVVLAEFIHSTPVLDPGTERLSIFQVRRVLKGSAEAHPNQIISVNLRCAGNIGDACLVLARKSDAAGVEWADI
ncbi:MAG: hypothetical protein JWM11_1374, partial [Planctomycetaceae bacterium]|nr:hypothetical protein [Planctomycetaceae bacterium]